MRRWLFRILAVCLALLLIAAVAIQVVLWTDYPKSLVLEQVQRTLGLRVTASAVSTGWFGTTRFRDVSVSLPLSETAFLEVPMLHVSHTWLPKLLFTRKLTVSALDLRSPRLLVTQGEQGRWNAQEVAELLARVSGKRQAEQDPSASRRRPSLPEIEASGGTVLVTDRAGRTATLANIAFSGRPESALLWRYELKAGDALELTGQLVPGGAWQHEVTATGRDLGRLASPWLGKLSRPLNLGVTWAGEWTNGQFEGRLGLQRVEVGPIEADGAMAVRAGGGTSVLRPEGLAIRTTLAALPELRLASGTISIEGPAMRAQRVQIQAWGGQAQIDGTWSAGTSNAEVNARWQDLILPGGIRHGGELGLSIKTPLPDRPQIDVALRSRGITREGDWNADLHLQGDGQSWREIDWTATANALSWAGIPTDLDLAALKARARQRGAVLTLDDIALDERRRLVGGGRLDLASRAGWLWLNGRDWPAPAGQSPLAFDLNLWADRSLIRLQQLYVRSGELQAVADGYYVWHVPRPVDLDVYLTHLPAPLQPERDPSLRGRLRSAAHLNGTAFPLDLAIAGRLYGDNLRFRQRPLGDAVVELRGNATRDQIAVTSTELELLGGRWSLVGTWLRETRLARLLIGVRGLPAERIGDAVARDDFAGALDGTWTFDLPNFDPARLSATGHFTAIDLRAGQGLVADTAEGEMKLNNGVLDVSPVHLTRGDGAAQASISVPLDRLAQPRVRINTESWPFDLPTTRATENDRGGAQAWVSGEIDLLLDLSDRHRPRASGPLHGTAAVTVSGRPVAKGTLNAQFSGRVADVAKLEGDALGGTFHGSGRADFDRLLAAGASLEWKNLDLARLSEFHPRFDGLVGTLSGTAQLSPATDPRALEPLRLDLSATPAGAAYRGMAIGPAALKVYFDDTRAVVKDTRDDPSSIEMAGGVVRVWGRVSRRPERATTRGSAAPTAGPGESSLGGTLELVLDHVDANQVVRAVQGESAKPVPARVSGRLTAVGHPRDMASLFGRGRLEFTESDLGNVKALAFLYDLMNVGAPREPIGSGTIDLQLEGTTLALANGTYFNRGVEVRVPRVDIKHIDAGGDAEILGTIIGTTRPLKNIRLPFLADADQILNVLQESLTPVEVSGPLRDYNLAYVPFKELSGTIKRLIAGEVQAGQRGR